ncbi:MAG: DUF3040 domain-containing protein [Bowdeniella nasicola]|nr:DUF3040 domain-containing protein [Bowdeniella nasicola]
MALSEYEQRVLAEMEQHLRADDPRLAQSMGSSAPGWDVRRVSLGILGLIVGLAGLVGGVATGHIWLGVLGFLIMLAGVLYALSSSPGAHKRSASKSTSDSFMARQNQRWDQRRQPER